MFTSVSNTYLVPNSASKNCNTCFDCLCNLKINKCEIYKCVQLITNYIRCIFVQKVSLQIDKSTILGYRKVATTEVHHKGMCMLTISLFTWNGEMSGDFTSKQPAKHVWLVLHY